MNNSAFRKRIAAGRAEYSMVKYLNNKIQDIHHALDEVFVNSRKLLKHISSDFYPTWREVRVLPYKRMMLLLGKGKPPPATTKLITMTLLQLEWQNRQKDKLSDDQQRLGWRDSNNLVDQGGPKFNLEPIFVTKPDGSFCLAPPHVHAEWWLPCLCR